ncbi:MAG TPA: sodium transporter, partial [Sphingobacterium sp.]|nr:sodium transporter [Sphingobacterium sp.]
QEYTGFVSPGIFAMFILGFFWKKATSNAALFATIGGFIFSIIFKKLPDWVDLSFLSSTGFSVPNPTTGVYEIPFLDRMGFVFVICIIGMILISIVDNKRGVVPAGLEVDTTMFKPHRAFLVIALIVALLVTALYSIYW